jgi:hypothetical protein
MQQNLLKDVSALTSVSLKTINKMEHVAELCICDYLNELDMQANDDIVSINVGFGTISMLVIDDSIQYQFVPSYSLEQKMIDTIENKATPLTSAAETNLENKLLATYKDLL